MAWAATSPATPFASRAYRTARSPASRRPARSATNSRANRASSTKPACSRSSMAEPTSSGSTPARRSLRSSSARLRHRTAKSPRARSLADPRGGAAGSRRFLRVGPPGGPAGPFPLTGRRPGGLLGGLFDESDLVAVERGHPNGGSHPALELQRDVLMIGEELLGVLPPLAELVTLVGEPGPALLDDLLGDAHVDQAALLGDALAVDDVELGQAERRGQLVLDHLHADPGSDHLAAVLQIVYLADVQPDRRIELQGSPAGGCLGIAEHHPDLLAQLVDEQRRGLEPGEGTGQLPHGLRHQPSLEADVRVAHLALDLRLGNQGGHRDHHHDVDGTGADHDVGDLQGLLAVVGLGHQKLVDVHPQHLRIVRIERVLGVDEHRDPAQPLGLRDDVQADRGLARTFRAEHLDDPPPRDASDAEGHVQRQRPGWDHRYSLPGRVLAQAHHGPLAELPLDLSERHLEHLLPFHLPDLPRSTDPTARTVAAGYDTNYTSVVRRSNRDVTIIEHVFEFKHLQRRSNPGPRTTSARTELREGRGGFGTARADPRRRSGMARRPPPDRGRTHRHPGKASAVPG